MVSDDIVTRLREYEAITDNAYVINALVAAADEIERLRELINHGLTDACQCAGCDLCEQLKAMHLQAVRGEQ